MFSVYVFLDDKNRPYYVGKTNNMVRRRKEHKEEIKFGNRLPKYRRARWLMSKGIAFKMRAIRKTKSEKEAYRLERYFIRHYRKLGYVLMNCTHGGPDELPMRINKPKKVRTKGIKLPTFKKKKVKKRKLVKKKRKKVTKARRKR